MFRFFRQIRQRLLANNAITKYLAYAFGEIILVVIGILIALGLNDYSDRKKSEARIEHLLTEVRSELAVNIELTDRITAFYHEKDSVIDLILMDTVTREMYETVLPIRLAIMNYMVYVVKSNAFERLMQDASDLPARYHPIVDQLKTIYVNNWDDVETFNEAMRLGIREYQNILKQTKPWYSEWIASPNLSDDATELMLSDPIFRNHVADYQNLGVYNHFDLIQTLRANAYEVYRNLNRELGLEDEIAGETNELFNAEEVVGLYTGDGDTVRITLTEGRLQFQLGQGDVEDIFPFSDTQFVPGNESIFCRFLKNEAGSVEGCECRLTFNRWNLVKE